MCLDKLFNGKPTSVRRDSTFAQLEKAADELGEVGKMVRKLKFVSFGDPAGKYHRHGSATQLRQCAKKTNTKGSGEVGG